MSGMFSQWASVTNLIFTCNRNNSSGQAHISSKEEIAGQGEGRCVLTVLPFKWCATVCWIWFRSDIPENNKARKGCVEMLPFAGCVGSVTNRGHLWSLSPAAKEMQHYKLYKISEAHRGVSKTIQVRIPIRNLQNNPALQCGDNYWTSDWPFFI